MKKGVVLGIIMLETLLNYQRVMQIKYTGKVKFLFMESKSNLTFKGDTVIEKQGGEVTCKKSIKLKIINSK